MQIAVIFMPPHLHVCSFSYIQWNLAEKKRVFTVVVFSAFSVILFLHGLCGQTVAPVGFIPAARSCNNTSVFFWVRPQ